MTNEPYNTRHYYGEKAGAGELRLSIFISQFFFMYAVADDKQFNEICEVKIGAASTKTLAEQVEFLVNNHQLTKGRYDKTVISVLNQQFTLLPEAYYSPEHARSMLTFATGVSEVRNLRQHQVHSSRFCYRMDDELFRYLERTFNNASIRHGGAVSASLFFSHHSLSGADIFMNLNGGLCEVAAKKDKQLSFYNIFSCETDEDILYYLMFSMEQLQLDPLNARLAVAADRLVTDSLLSDLKKYIKHIVFCAPDPAVQLSGELGHLPNHQFFTLLHQHQCEL
jgi:hypothetical protein